jgi:hypothetical protein
MDTRDIERSRNGALSDYAPLSGILIFAALMCLCIILLANGVKRSGAILAQTAFRKVPVATAQTEALAEAQAPSSSPIAQRGDLQIAPALASSQSSGEASVMPDQGESERKLALSDKQRTKSIREDPRRFAKVREVDLRKSTANLYSISGSPPMGASRHLKMLLVALWQRSLHRSKISRNGYTPVTKLRS